MVELSTAGGMLPATVIVRALAPAVVVVRSNWVTVKYGSQEIEFPLRSRQPLPCQPEAQQTRSQD